MATSQSTRRKAPAPARPDAQTAAPARRGRTRKATVAIEPGIDTNSEAGLADAAPAPAPAPADEASGVPAASADTPARPARRTRAPRGGAGTAAAAPVADVAPAAAEPPVKAEPAVEAHPEPRHRRSRQRPAEAVAPPAASQDEVQRAAPADDTAQAVLALLSAPVPARQTDQPSPTPAPAPAPAPSPAAVFDEPAPTTGPQHSRIELVDGDRRQLAWRPGQASPLALRQAARQRLDEAGHFAPDDDAALPTLLRLAAEAHHPLQVDEAVWAHLAAHRDARNRLHRLELAYPDGPASPAFAQLLRSALPLFQAEGALFAVVAGRALIADERGLGKGVQAIAAARLWQRHFGVQRVLVLCATDQRAAWRRAWMRFTGAPAAEAPQVMDGGLHQRQALWSSAAGVRILSPEALDSDAAHLAQWAPDLVIVDEPQRLGLRDAAWAALAAPHALVLCGAALAEQPALMQAIVAWLDTERLGPLAALHELQAAAESDQGLDEADVERLTLQLSRLMLQRLRADVAGQLPPLVHTERLLPLAPGQRESHDRHLTTARRSVENWRRSGYLSDSDQWALALALRGMQQAAHRADPADANAALADATLQALLAQLDDWAGTGAPRVAVLCPQEGDVELLTQRLADRGALAATDEAGQLRVQLVAPGAPLPAGVDAVIQIGVPWRPRRHPAGARDGEGAGQQWVYLVAQDSLDTGLFDTLAQRLDAPRGLADGGRDYLQGERLAEWLRLVQAALSATETGG